MALVKGSLLALVRDLNERALTLLEKDLDTVVHASGNYLWFDITTTLYYPFYPCELVPCTSQVHILFSTHPSRCHKPLKDSVDNIKINLQSPH